MKNMTVVEFCLTYDLNLKDLLTCAINHKVNTIKDLWDRLSVRPDILWTIITCLAEPNIVADLKSKITSYLVSNGITPTFPIQMGNIWTDEKLCTFIKSISPNIWTEKIGKS